ncbi:MAG: SusD/RagB family nutrient-binding outer membrane lipoprotein [Cytophagales bacterium]|nr:SusD/RagB family nutrient-binding outer membrane lipoprotein [Cytophagales bacterium]
MRALTYTFLLLAALVSSCSDLEDLQVDPNRATQTHPALLLTNIEAITFNYIDIGASLASRQLAFTDGASGEQYYNWQRAGFGRYNTLRQIVKMDQEAERLNLINYRALALFLKSVQILELTKVFGDVPYTEALQAEEGVFSPAYDTQEQIYLKVLADLEEANSMLNASNGVITGDIIYEGEITKWKKLINSFTLRVLMSMSKKGGATGTQVVNRFNTIVSNPATYPIFESNQDNASLKFLDLVGNRYPFFNSNSLKTAYYMEESFVNLLKNLSDPRLFVFADRTPDAVDSNIPATDFAAYDGLDGSAPLATNTNRVVAGEVSKVNLRYYDSPVNEASNLLSYAEVEFILAEAAARGWISATAKDHYDNGVRASFQFFGVAGANAYLLGAGAYNPANGIRQIVTQKYINFFMNGGWEGFYNNLRTGFPVFSVSGGGVLNDQLVPKRWMYPQNELLYNKQNVEAAIQRQYATDNINGEMWLLKN